MAIDIISMAISYAIAKRFMAAWKVVVKVISIIIEIRKTFRSR